MSKKQWREVALADSCCGCGSVLTDLENDEAWDGDEARCDCCGRPGHVSADEDGAHVNWHDEPTCQCWWCQIQDELTLLRAQLADAKATIARWEDITRDELACTMQLIDAAGVRGRVEAGEAVQAVLLDVLRKSRSAPSNAGVALGIPGAEQ